MSPLSLHFSDLQFDEVPGEGGLASGLLVLVHGRTGHRRVMNFFTKRPALSSMAKLLVQAPYPDTREDQNEPGFSWYIRDQSRALVPETGLHPIVEGHLDHARDCLSALAGALVAAGWKTSQIYWLGFSQGSAMILDLALRDPRRFGGFVCVSGFCMPETIQANAFSPMAWDQRILITHGRRDSIVTLADADRSYEFLRAQKIPFTWKVFDKPHSFKLNEELPFIEQTLKAWISHPEDSKA